MKKKPVSSSQSQGIQGSWKAPRRQRKNGNQSHYRLSCIQGSFIGKGCCPLLPLLFASVNFSFTLNPVLTVYMLGL